MLKSDFHIHTHEDAHDTHCVKYSAKDMIRHASLHKFEVLSITHHNKVFFTNEIRSYAKKKGILLIPGAEPKIEDSDVLIIDINNDELKKLKSLDSLEKIYDSSLIIAPHPYFLFGNALRKKLDEHIDLFHAIEYGHFFTRPLINPFFSFIGNNHKAQATARRFNKPMVGTSDMHKFYEMGRTYSLIDCDKTKDDVIEAIKHGKIKVVNNPMKMHLFFTRAAGAVGEKIQKKILGIKEIPNVSSDPILD